MDNIYHAILLNVSFDNPDYPLSLKVINKIEFENSDWVVYCVEIPEDEVEKRILEIQERMVIGKFFNHVYNADKLIVIFKDKIFRLAKDTSTWNDAVNYGRSIGIPEDQLNFKPFNFEDEREYFTKNA